MVFMQLNSNQCMEKTEGFVYLVVIIDWYSRYVLDWQISINMEADFCVEVL